MHPNKRRKCLLIASFLLLLLLSHHEVQHASWRKSYNNHLLGKKRRKKKRILWSTVNERISDIQFRRMFRMNRSCFDSLCQCIISKIGESKFKSESYIDALKKNKDQMYDANVKATGGYISGEVKLAIALRMLAGGDSYDLAVIFDVHFDHCSRILQEVLLNWVIKTGIGDLNMVKYLGDKEAMARVSAGFSKRSNGVLIGAIGAIDGWLVRIVRPSWFRDRIKNPTTFFSRKGFFALNVQCIVDDRKKVLWVSYSHKGGSHDSSCFRESKLYQFLQTVREDLFNLGYYILGDSAYAIESFILTPYDGASPQTAEDDFNFYQSSARITVECAFGEIDLRWGIFWKRLTCSLDHASVIIEGAMRLHNFIIDYRDEHCNTDKEVTDRRMFTEDISNNGAMVMVVGDDQRHKGRISNDEKEYRLKGLQLRDRLRISLMNHDMRRAAREEWSGDENNYVIRTLINN